MKRAGSIWKSMVYPSGGVLVCAPLLSFAALAVSFAYAKIGNALTYVIYGLSAYYLVLGGLRVYLIVCYRRRTPALEARCYRRTAWLLFLLNIPMGGMIALMVRANASFSYPGTIIYASSLYTFYTMALAIINLVKYRRLGSPILSAAKVLNLVSAMMSILGLQTAMISQFDPGNEAFRKTMNTMTGSVVYGVVILIALWMLRHGRKERKNVE